MALPTLQRRVRQVVSGMDLAELPTFSVLSRAGIRFDPSKMGLTKLRAALDAAQFHPDVIIVEALRRVLDGDEISARDINAFWHRVEPLVQAGGAFVISHHMKKPSPNGSNHTRHRASGSTDILAGADAALAIQRASKDAFIVEQVKCRDAEEIAPFAVSLEGSDPTGPVTLRYEGTPADFKAQASKSAQAEHDILAFLQAAPEQAARAREILAHLKSRGVSERTGESALRILKADQRVLAGVRGRYSLPGSDPQTNRRAQTPHIDNGCGASAAAPASPSPGSAMQPLRFAVAEPWAGNPEGIFNTPCAPIPPGLDADDDAA